MKEIFQYIDELDKSGNYRLADKIENDVKKVYAQAIATSQFPPGYADFVLKQMVLKQMSQPSKKETDTLSPAKNVNVDTIRKQVNTLLSDKAIKDKKLKELENNFSSVGSLDSKLGTLGEVNDTQDKNITNNTNDITKNSDQIMQLEESIQTLK